MHQFGFYLGEIVGTNCQFTSAGNGSIASQAGEDNFGE